MALEHLLLAVTLAAYPIGALGALGVRGAAGRGLVAGCALVGSLSGLVLGTICLAAGRGPTITARSEERRVGKECRL